MCGYYVWQMPLGVSKLKASRREVRHYTPCFDPRDWLDILRRKRFRVFHEKNVRRKLFSRVDTFHLCEHKKDKYYVYNNDQQHWLMNASHYGRRPSYIFFFFLWHNIRFSFIFMLPISFVLFVVLVL